MTCNVRLNKPREKTKAFVFGSVVKALLWLWLRLWLDQGLLRRIGNSGLSGAGDGDACDSIDDKVNCELIMMNSKARIALNQVYLHVKYA